MGEGLQNHDVTYYSALTGKPIPREPGETYLWRKARAYGQLNRDRKQLISSVNGGLSVWDVATRQQIVPQRDNSDGRCYRDVVTPDTVPRH